MEAVVDVETDGLDPKQVWIIAAKEIETGKVHLFKRPDIDAGERKRFNEFASTVTKWIGHNFIKFDYLVVLRRFFPELKLDPSSILDTLVCSRLFNYAVEGGHSLDAWATRLGMVKPKITDWSQGLTPEMEHRATEDIEINYRLYRFLEKHIKHERYARALVTEHRMEFVCYDMHIKGFGFDRELATKLQLEISDELAKLDREIAAAFPPRYRLVREVQPRATKSGALSMVDFRWAGEGADLTAYSPNAPFSLIVPEPFNPASTSQIVERLNEAEQALRRCRVRTERDALESKLADFRRSGWSVDEDNLDTLPEDAPEGARKLAQRILLAARRSVLQEWLNAYNEATESIHGSFMGIGAWTGRMSHQRPNQANIPTKPDVKDEAHPTPVEAWKLKYSSVFRSAWRARKGRRLIGVDADGIQLRILAHYMNDPEFIKALVSGDKKIGTDAHSLNAIKLGFDWRIARDRAKTFIYAWLLGAGLDKVAFILHTSNKGAKTAVDSFIEGYPGLKALKTNQIPADAKRGFFYGLDGRLVPVPSEHKTLAGYLQNGESIIMKEACLLWRSELREKKIPFWQVDFVHDEWQTEVEDDDEIAALVIKTQVDAIVQTGINLKMNCPLAGEGKQGYTWMETH
jgi:DNA polymerase I